MSVPRPAMGTMVKSMPMVREEISADHDAIQELNRIAFGGNIEAEQVDRLRG